MMKLKNWLAKTILNTNYSKEFIGLLTHTLRQNEFKFYGKFTEIERRIELIEEELITCESILKNCLDQLKKGQKTPNKDPGTNKNKKSKTKVLKGKIDDPMKKHEVSHEQ